MKVSIFSKFSIIFFISCLFTNSVFSAGEEFPQRVVYVNGSYLIPLINGYKRVMADVSRVHEEKRQDLQKKYNEVAGIQSELDDLRRLINDHKDDIDFVDPATGSTLSELQTQFEKKSRIVTDFQVEVQKVEQDMADLKSSLLAPIITRYNSILEAFIKEKKENEGVSYIILDKSCVASADTSFDITDIIKKRIGADNERRERNIKNNAANEPVSD